MIQGYYSQPTISDTQIVFISDDDMWSVPKEGGTAQRLTSNRGHILSPCFSPDGKNLAYVSTDTATEGDVYLMSAEGGFAERLTWLGVQRITGWKNNETLYFVSGMEGYPRRQAHVYELNIKTREFKKVDLGPASYYHQGKGFQVLARISGDPARWKRYLGGTAGVIWTQQGAGKFQRILKNIKTNIAKPEVIGKNIYFITDHEGVANVYVCDLNGQNLKRLTNHLEYYCRALRAHGNTLVYQCGAEIYTYNVETKSEQKINISAATTGMQSVPRYESWSKNFQHAAVHPTASELAVVTRGHLFLVPPFSGPVKELDAERGVRYVCPNYNFDGNKLIAAAAEGEEDEGLYLFDLKQGTKKPLFPQQSWGKIWEIKSSPKADQFVLVNHKSEVYVLDLKKNSFKLITESAKGSYVRPSEFDWSPDGRYFAFTAAVDSRRNGVWVYDTQKSQLKLLLNPVCSDSSPSFDPEGKYLYFIGVREFAPVYNETHFDLGFPFAMKPYVVALTEEAENPFQLPLQNPKAAEKDEAKPEKEKKVKELKVEIEFDGIENRVLPFKLDMGGYLKITGIKGGVLYSRQKVLASTQHPRHGAEANPSVYLYKFEDCKEVLFQANVSYGAVNASRTHALLLTDSKLRLIETKVKPTEEKQVGKKDGFVDVTRIKLKVDPRLEWVQMYREAWILQKEHFWRKDLSKIDWDVIYTRYAKLLQKVNTRTEFSDLMWEMQGELGTSHCYEMLGDYNRVGAGVGHGRLGAFFSFDSKSKSYRIDRILKGSSWDTGSETPLTMMGVRLSEGDRILAVDGFTFEKTSDLYEFLENKVKVAVALTVHRKGSAKAEVVEVKPNAQMNLAWYREWVEQNKKYVHEISKGRLGYVHIPDMGPYGYAEFYKHYIAESDKEGMVIDVRFNGGGHVSQHLLKVLAQKTLGFDETRHQGLMKYPLYTPGAMVAIANEFSGSDGDIFPHCFKLMKLGKLVGKRTWGGIIGINGQYTLKDGTWVTQPEYSFWFKDNEWKVENYGVDPDIEVEMTPEDYQNGRDPQLDRAIKEAMAELKKNPVLKFKPSYYPDLSLPKKLQKLNR
jgi:tricorn protease